MPLRPLLTPRPLLKTAAADAAAAAKTAADAALLRKPCWTPLPLLRPLLMTLLRKPCWTPLPLLRPLLMLC